MQTATTQTSLQNDKKKKWINLCKKNNNKLENIHKYMYGIKDFSHIHTHTHAATTHSTKYRIINQLSKSKYYLMTHICKATTKKRTKQNQIKPKPKSQT